LSAVSSNILDVLWYDLENREMLLRQIITEQLDLHPTPSMDQHIVASYFFAFRTLSLADAVEEISYHATSGIRHPPKGSLLEACSAIPAGISELDTTGRIGLMHIAFPLKMMVDEEGKLASNDILHTTAAAIIFDVYENQDARLVNLNIPSDVIAHFPGPAYGPGGVRHLTSFPPDQPAFGTILKPTAGITPQEVGRLVGEVAGNPLFLFIKEDEDLYPNLPYSPVAERTKQAVTVINQEMPNRGGRGLLYAPHISGPPHEVLTTVEKVLEAGANGVMLSETWSGGSVRMIREATKHLEQPPAIYGHNAGIGVKTRGIWREALISGKLLLCVRAHLS
jgi:ribulose-bisphosphate carboxylase large chain